MTGKPWWTPECRKEIGDMIKAEVQHQLSPVLQQITDVKRENESQSKLLQALDNWRKALWGDGSGTKGFLEKAREEDKAQLQAMKDGFEKMQNSMDTEQTVAARVAEAMSNEATKRERKFGRVIAVLSVVAALLGGGLLEHLLSGGH